MLYKVFDKDYTNDLNKLPYLSFPKFLLKCFEIFMYYSWLTYKNSASSVRESKNGNAYLMDEIPAL